jgi:hypothetical protein
LRVFTIGFTRKSAETFFTTLIESGAKRVVDVRLNNVSQLAGFSKRDDLRYFLRAIGGLDYAHVPELAPTQELLDAYRKRGGDWPAYERAFLALMEQRRVEETVPHDLITDACLLCSEETAERCHRRLVAEYLRDRWGDTANQLYCCHEGDDRHPRRPLPASQSQERPRGAADPGRDGGALSPLAGGGDAGVQQGVNRLARHLDAARR